MPAAVLIDAAEWKVRSSDPWNHTEFVHSVDSPLVQRWGLFARMGGCERFDGFVNNRY